MPFKKLLLLILVLPLHAEIPHDMFQTMITFLRTTPLNTATNSTFMQYAKQISTEGSDEQQAQLETILADEETAPTPTDQTLTAIAQILKSDIITPETWQKKVIAPLAALDMLGSAEDKKKTTAFLKLHLKECIHHMRSLIESVYHNPMVLEALKYIVMGTLIGVIPSVGLKTLSIASGNMIVSTATQQLTDLAILSALDSIVQYGLQNKTGPFAGPIAAALSSAVQDFVGYIGPRPSNLSFLGFQFTTAELAVLQAGAIAIAKETFVKSGKAEKIVSTLNWQDVVIGNQEIVPTSEESSLVSYLGTTLATIVNNQTVRSVCATTISYAIEGALIAASLNAAGIGFYGESTTHALLTGMMRGGLEGLYLHALNKTTTSGILQRVQSGFAITSLQQYISAGALQMTVGSMVPLVTQQVIAGAVNVVVQKNGGWRGLMKNIFG